MSDVQLPPQGQEPPAPAQDKAGVDSPYFDYDYGDGRKVEFKTREDLQKAWRNSHLMQSDYTRKTQEIAEQKKAFQKEMEDFKAQQKTFAEAKRRYDEWDQRLKSRPDIYQQLSNMTQQPLAPDHVIGMAKGYADEKTEALAKKIEEMEKKAEEDRINREIESIYTKLEGEYPDFDREAIQELLGNITDGKPEPLLRTLYLAHKGRMSPAQIEEKITDNLAKKKTAGLVPAKGSPPSAPKKPTNLKEAHQMALRDAGIRGG